jgi:hypothetical protein
MDQLVNTTKQLAHEAGQFSDLVSEFAKGDKKYAFMLTLKHEELTRARSAVEDEMTLFYGTHVEDGESAVDTLRGKTDPAELEEAFRVVLNGNIALLYGMEIHTEPGQETPQVVELQETMEIFHARLKELYALDPRTPEFTEAHEKFKQTICEDIVRQFMKCVLIPELKTTVRLNMVLIMFSSDKRKYTGLFPSI